MSDRAKRTTGSDAAQHAAAPESHVTTPRAGPTTGDHVAVLDRAAARVQSDPDGADLLQRLSSPQQQHALLALQQTHGNAAVQRLVPAVGTTGNGRDRLATGHSLQRSPNAGKTKQRMGWDEAFPVMQGIVNIVNQYYEKRDKPPFYVPKTHPQHQNVPSQYMDLLTEWFMITIPKVKLKSGAIVSYRGPMLTEHINSSMKETAPFISVLLKEGDQKTKPWLDAQFYKPVKSFRERARKEEAADLVSKTAGRLGTVLDPKTAATESNLRELLNLTLSSMGSLGNLIDVRADIHDKIDANLDKIWKDHKLPGPWAPKLKGLRASEALGELGTILGAVKDVLDLADPKAREQLFNKMLGAWGTVQGVADIIAKGLSITQGAVSAACVITAAVSRAAGYAKEGLKLLRAAGAITSFTGYLGKAIGVLSMIKGSISLCHPKSSAMDRASGVADIALGVAAITGGALGGALTGGALSFKANLAIIEQGVGASKGLVWWSLSKCYQSMAKYGELIALNANRVIAGLALIEADSDPIRKRYLRKEVNEAASKLRLFIGALLKPSTDVSDPGAWTPLRKRLRRAGSPPTSKTSPVALVKQAKSVLAIVQEVFAKRNTILNEATKEAWEKYG